MLACDSSNQKAKLIINQNSQPIWSAEPNSFGSRKELTILKKSQVPRNHVLNRLVGARLNKTQLDHHSKYPAIIPRNGQRTSLIIQHSHSSTLNGHAQLTLAHTRQEFLIIGGRAPVKSFILKCVTYARYRGQRAQQLMEQLPMTRVTPSSPFTHTGIDYIGSININSWKGRGSKTYKWWSCIFMCFSTSAVHLELVSDYSADGFVVACRRFTSRRGIPSYLYSDCGTNFIRADKELKILFKQSQRENSTLYHSLINNGTQWIFNPPAAPHMGEKWEAVVKSIKFHLRRTIGDNLLTSEAIATLLTQIEGLLNSRPLEPLSEDPEDVNALTPGRFIIDKAINSLPEPSLLKINESRLSWWQLIQRITQQFSQLWSTQYLQRPQSISKWHHPSHEIKLDSMVLLTDERSPPSKGPLARVTQLHPGTDNLTRVITLKTATTQLTRLITKLAMSPVPIGNEINLTFDGGPSVWELGNLNVPRSRANRLYAPPRRGSTAQRLCVSVETHYWFFSHYELYQSPSLSLPCKNGRDSDLMWVLVISTWPRRRMWGQVLAVSASSSPRGTIEHHLLLLNSTAQLTYVHWLYSNSSDTLTYLFSPSLTHQLNVHWRLVQSLRLQGSNTHTTRGWLSTTCWRRYIIIWSVGNSHMQQINNICLLFTFNLFHCTWA